MKRSAMIRIIWESINELEDADHVLQRIEKAGMLPPFSNDIHQKTWREGGTGHQWEPEELGSAQHNGPDSSET